MQKDTNQETPLIEIWQQTIARVALHPSWPLRINVFVASLGDSLSLQCVVHTYDAQDRENPLADLDMLDICFSWFVPENDLLWHAHDRLRFVLNCLRQTALHELDEFLLVDGSVGQSPHSTVQRCFPSKCTAECDGIEAWQAAVGRVSLHPAWQLLLDLRVASVDLKGAPIITCVLRQPKSSKDATSTVLTALSRTMAVKCDDRVQQLLALVKCTVQCLLDCCLLVDGIRRLSAPVINLPRGNAGILRLLNAVETELGPEVAEQYARVIEAAAPSHKESPERES